MYILAIIIIFTGLIFVFNLKPEDIMKRKNITTVIIACFAICFILILIAVVHLVKFGKESTDYVKQKNVSFVTEKPISTDNIYSNMETGKAGIYHEEYPGSYYVQSLEGEIVVYYDDKETVYDYTGINTDSFGENDREKLKKGFFIEDEESLYALLESYSS